MKTSPKIKLLRHQPEVTLLTKEWCYRQKTYGFGPDPNSKQLVRVLSDLCSQRAYISEELKRKLNFKSLKTVTLNLNTFGTDKFRKQKCDRVELNLEGKNAL